MSTLVSIIVPCYNQAHFLKESLQSVLEQTYTAWECIIVNDGSPDDTESQAMRWCEKDDRFKYVYKENGGLSSARNAGIQNCEGTFILPLDADDMLHMSFLEKLVPVLENGVNIGVVSCNSIFFEDSISNVVNKREPKGESYHALLFENIMMASSLYRKESWAQVGGYDESMKHGLEDWEFWIAITKGGMTISFVDEYLFYYRKSKRSMLTHTIKNHLEDTSKYVYKKHREIYIDKFDTTMDYLFYLIKKHRLSEDNLKTSLEYKIGKVITKPFRLIKGLLRYKK
ncbi:glycosyltransferase family 2 protein [Dokdonia sp. Asnod1-B02]|uniref:glycosyltransferase family 2 protein n=1 Tax=Dokdonia sp. Asnod1-B02 TaxID=3160573 RepID=UPI0038632BEE